METKISALFTISLRDAFALLCELEDINFPPNAIIQMSSNTFLVTQEDIYWDLCDILEENDYEYSIS